MAARESAAAIAGSSAGEANAKDRSVILTVDGEPSVAAVRGPP